MTSSKVCACKGIRSCIVCEEVKNKKKTISTVDHEPKISYRYCVACCKAFKWSEHKSSTHPSHDGEAIDFPGVELIPDFVDREEEIQLCEEIDKTPWVDSQSGRRKQDYGPKVNFKKRKLKTSVFTGLPSFSKMLVDRFQQHPSLASFIPVELCNLEYIPERGSAIDQHFDDFWLWGERLVTLNLASQTVHTMTKDDVPNVEVDIVLPPRTLIVATGPARYEWKHGIRRENINSRRIAMTFRELTPEFLKGGDNEIVGKEVIEVALTFKGRAVGSQAMSSG